jgi:predicted nuclease with TOPRIM domain
MSEPKRYEPSSHYSADFGMAQSPVGKWVSYEDYARLKAEVDAWKDMVADSGVACNERARENQDLENQIERLKAEVESVRKYWKSTGEGVNRYVGKSIALEDEVTRLKAEVERLKRLVPSEDDLNRGGYNP